MCFYTDSSPNPPTPEQVIERMEANRIQQMHIYRIPPPTMTGIELWRQYARSESFRNSPSGSQGSSGSKPSSPVEKTPPSTTIQLVMNPILFYPTATPIRAIQPIQPYTASQHRTFRELVLTTE